MLTPEQIEQRKNSIGASEVSSILGLNPWKSALQLWLEKTGAVEPGDNRNEEEKEWGNRLETLIGEKFAQNHPETRVDMGQFHHVHPVYPFITCTLDGVVTDAEMIEYPLEIKTASAYKAKDWEYGVPTYYLCQVQHQMAVTGAEKAWVAVLIGGQIYKEFLVLRDEEFIKLLIEKCVAFWQGVIECIPPEADGSESSDRALKTLYPADVDGKEVDLPSEIENAINLKIIYDREADGYELQSRALANKIKQALGDAEQGRVGNWLVSYKASKAGHRILRIKEVTE